MTSNMNDIYLLCHGSTAIASDQTVCLIPWRCRKFLVWNATCVDVFAPSYRSLATHEAGTVAARAVVLNEEKYSDLLHTHEFTPVTMESSGVSGPWSCFM